MVTSGFSSEVIRDPSQHWSMDGYGRGNVDTVNYTGDNPAKNGKKGSYNASTALPTAAGYPGDFHSGDASSSYAPRSTNCINDMHGMNNARSAKNGKNVNFRSVPEGSGMASYPTPFWSSETDSHYLPNTADATTIMNKTNCRSTGDNMTTAKNSDKGNINQQSTLPLACGGYPRAFESSKDGSSFTDDTEALCSTHRTNSTSSPNIINTINTMKNGKKDNCHQPSAAPATATSSTAFQTAEAGSTFTYNTDTMYSTNSVNNMNATKNDKKGIYRPSMAAPAITAYPSEMGPGQMGSTLSHNTDKIYSTNHATTTDGGDAGNTVNYPHPTGMPARATHSGAHQSNGRYYSSTRSTDTMHNKSSVNNANNMNTARNAKTKSNYQHPAASSASTAYPCAVQSGKIDSKFSSTNGNTIYNTNSIQPVNTTKNGKKANYISTTSGPATTSSSSGLQLREVDSDSDPISAAWEEHIDVATNTMYYYNNITRRSTWGEPSGMVKRVPPPPQSQPPMAPMFKKREQDQWFRIRDCLGRTMWYNEITRESQVERPDCLRKYR